MPLRRPLTVLSAHNSMPNLETPITRAHYLPANPQPILRAASSSPTLRQSTPYARPRRQTTDERCPSIGHKIPPNSSTTLLQKVLLKNAPKEISSKKRARVSSKMAEGDNQERETKTGRANEPTTRRVVVRMSEDGNPTILSVINTDVKESYTPSASPVNEVPTDQLIDLLTATNHSSDAYCQSEQIESTDNEKQTQTTISLCLPIRRFAADAAVQTDAVACVCPTDRASKRHRRREKIQGLHAELERLRRAVDGLSNLRGSQRIMH